MNIQNKENIHVSKQQNITEKTTPTARRYLYTALCQGCFWRTLGVPDVHKKPFDDAVAEHIRLTRHKVSVHRDKI